MVEKIRESARIHLLKNISIGQDYRSFNYILQTREYYRANHRHGKASGFFRYSLNLLSGLFHSGPSVLNQQGNILSSSRKEGNLIGKTFKR